MDTDRSHRHTNAPQEDDLDSNSEKLSPNDIRDRALKVLDRVKRLSIFERLKTTEDGTLPEIELTLRELENTLIGFTHEPESPRAKKRRALDDERGDLMAGLHIDEILEDRDVAGTRSIPTRTTRQAAAPAIESQQHYFEGRIEALEKASKHKKMNKNVLRLIRKLEQLESEPKVL